MTEGIKSLTEIIIQQNNEIMLLRSEIKSLKEEIENVRKIAAILCVNEITNGKHP